MEIAANYKKIIMSLTLICIIVGAFPITAQATNVSPYATATGSSASSGYGVSEAIDGSSTTYWTPTTASGAWIQLNWNYSINISEIYLNFSTPLSAPDSGILTFSDGTSIDLTLGSADSNITETFATKQVTWVRYTAAASTTSCSIYEFKANKPSPKAPIVNTMYSNQSVITGTAEARSTVRAEIWSGEDVTILGTATVEAATTAAIGNYVITVPKQTAETGIVVIATDSYGGKSLYTAIGVQPSVTFDKNGGDTEASPTTKGVAYEGNVGSLPAAPTKTGCIFVGWNTAADGTGSAFTDSTEVTSDITAYAKWIMKGDSNQDGVVDILDAQEIRKRASGIISSTSLEIEVCDMNDDGIISISDAREVTRRAAGLE